MIYWVAGTLLGNSLVASGPLGISRFQHVSQIRTSIRIGVLVLRLSGHVCSVIQH